nr:uncharacterized protein LOC126528390 [Dermacentor andersoni]
MAYCCVPLCKSDEKKKTAALSFHEIPADTDARARWLGAIRRDKWSPNTTSCYTKVCSRHFKEEDFIEGKRRRLKKGAVPSVFEEYPSHLQPKSTPARNTTSIDKRVSATMARNDSASGTAMEQSMPAAAPTSSVENMSDCCSMDTSTAANSCDQSVQVNIKSTSSVLVTERAKWIRKEKALRSQLLRLQQTVDRYKVELKTLHEDALVADVSYIKERAEEKEPAARFLIDQIQNFRKKRPSWCEETIRRCVVLRHLSARAYEHIRGEMLLKLPCRKTLSNYFGTTRGETGFSKLAEDRLRVEAESLSVPQSRVCSLIVDEMKIKEKLQYNKQQDCFVGHADVSLEQQGGDLTLANSLLCFLITGLSTSYRIPVAYYFTKGLAGPQLHKLLIFVLEKVEACGFRVVRLVSDNHKVNVNAMKLLGDGLLTYRITHPCDCDRLLFLSFDPCHVLKNVRSQFLAHDFGPKGEVSSCYIKKLYELQKDLVVKPVRYLSRKHVYPNNIEKMNVARAIQVLSPDVTAALEPLRNQAGHTSSFSFADAGQTIIFMHNMYRWFVLHDTSNTTQHIHKKWPDTRHFDDAEDARLEWLEVALPMYLDKLKKRCRDKKEFFTKETYEALLLTTYSTVACIKYLLTEEKFLFVLTRKFNSDPIESLFGTLRMSAGCNDTLNVRSVLSGLEKVLKTGIAASSATSNVAHRERAQMSTGTLHTEASPSPAQQLPQLQRAACVLQRLNTTVLPQQLPSLEISATAYVGGYIARVINEHMRCESCSSVCTKPASNQPILQLTRSQDRGGLLYPSDQLLFAVDVLRTFADRALKDNPTLQKPLSTLVKYAVPALCASNLLKCKDSDAIHRVKLMELISVRFLRPLLVNYAFNVSDKHDAFKYFAKKPQSRKYVKL